MDIHAKLKLIREGHSIEDINSGTINESGGLGELILFATALSAIGVYKHIKSVKEKKQMEQRRKEEKEKAESQRSQIKASVEEYLKHTSQRELDEKVKSDIKKIVEKFKSDSKAIGKIKQSLEKINKDGDSYKRHLVYIDKGSYIQIIQGDESVCKALYWVIEDIVDAIEMKYEEEVGLGLVDIGGGYGINSGKMEGFIVFK